MPILMVMGSIWACSDEPASEIVGVPVVATRVGGVPDVVTEEEAILVPSEEPETFARGVWRVLDKLSDAGQQAERAGRGPRQKFAPEPWLDAYEDLYQTVTSSNRSLD